MQRQGTQIITADVCVYGNGGNHSWFVRADSPPAGAKDLVGLLTHELGHALGMDHVVNTVMDAAGFNTGNTLGRFQYGTDFDLIQQKYGTASYHFFSRSLPDTSTTAWSGEHNGNFVTYLGENASLGYSGVANANKIMIGAVNNQNAWFVRHSATSTSPYDFSHFIGGSLTIRAPGVAGSDFGTWVGAWTRKQADNTSCADITVHVSTDDFVTASTLDLTGDCTIHDPFVAYAAGVPGFFLLYTQRSSTPSQDNQVMFRFASNSNLQSWSAAQTLPGVISLDAPTLSCPELDTTCLLTFLSQSGDDVPHVEMVSVTVGPGGSITTGPNTISSDFYWKTVPGTVRETLNSGRQWAIVDNFTSDVMNSELNGSYQIWSSVESSIPLALNNWSFTGATAIHRPTVAGDSNYFGTPMFVFYTR